MPLSNERITEITKYVVKSSFFKYFLCREAVSTQHILLAKLFPLESVVRSAIGGLETSLGTSLWEQIAKKIATENEFEIIDNKTAIQQPNPLPIIIRNLLAEHIELRKQPGQNIPISTYAVALQRAIDELNPNEIPFSYTRITKGSGIDVYLRKHGCEYAFDIKTVQINAGSGVKLNSTLMEWITYKAIQQKFLNTTFEFSAHIVIPYDPHIDSDWWSEFEGRAYPLDHNDLMLGNEFWNFISGCENTIESIEMAFNDLVNEGFQDTYRQCLYETGTHVGVNILSSFANVSCLENYSALPNNFTSKILWKCNHCETEFRSSIKWFLEERKCSCISSYLIGQFIGNISIQIGLKSRKHLIDILGPTQILNSISNRIVIFET